MSKWQAVIISMLLIILFFSRAIYNIVAVALHKSHRKLVAFLEFATDLVRGLFYLKISTHIHVLYFKFHKDLKQVASYAFTQLICCNINEYHILLNYVH